MPTLALTLKGGYTETDKVNPNVRSQPRDNRGRWTRGGGSGLSPAAVQRVQEEWSDVTNAAGDFVEKPSWKRAKKVYTQTKEVMAAIGEGIVDIDDDVWWKKALSTAGSITGVAVKLATAAGLGSSVGALVGLGLQHIGKMSPQAALAAGAATAALAASYYVYHQWNSKRQANRDRRDARRRDATLRELESLVRTREAEAEKTRKIIRRLERNLKALQRQAQVAA